MNSDELCYLELVEVGRRIQARQLSSVEVTQAVLDRIARLDPRLKAYATLTPDLALAQAREADREISRGTLRGPLHGVPIAVKDLCHTKGIPTAAGMPIHKEYRPDRDATVVSRLRAAGAIVLGKLQLTEGAFGAHHPAIDPPINPWSAAHWTGVSSSGSGVATAAGLCYGSLGSDTGGSIRFPSTMNGVTGLKPTWGRVSRAGVFALAESMDHIGPMTRSAGMRAPCWAQSLAPIQMTRRLRMKPCLTISVSSARGCARFASASTARSLQQAQIGTWCARPKRPQASCCSWVARSWTLHFRVPMLLCVTGYPCAASKRPSPTRQPTPRVLPSTVPCWLACWRPAAAWMAVWSPRCCSTERLSAISSTLSFETLIC